MAMSTRRTTVFELSGDLNSTYMRKTTMMQNMSGMHGQNGIVGNRYNTVSGEMGKVMSQPTLSRKSTMGRTSKGGGVLKSDSQELSNYSTTIILFAKEHGVMIGRKPPEECGLGDAQLMYIQDFFNIFEKVIQISLDPDFCFDQPPQKDKVGSNLNEKKLEYYKNNIIIYVNLLKIVGYGEVEEVDKQFTPQFVNFSSMKGKTMIIAFKSLSYLIELVNV